MNILFAALSISKGGVARVCNNLTKGFTDAGNKVYAISVHNESSAPYIQRWVFDAPYEHSALNRTQIEKLHDRFHFDYVILAEPQLSWMFDAIAVLKNKTKLIGHLHNSPFGMYSHTDRLGFLPLSSFLVRKAIFNIHAVTLHDYYKTLSQTLDQMVLLSSTYYKELLKLAYFPEEKLSAIANPVLMEEKPRVEKKNTILYVGRISPEKRIYDILRIWEDVSTELKGWNLEIVGYGKELSHWIEYAKKKKIANISFEGFQQPEDYYNKSKILLMTSLYEGFGMVLVEGMQYGCVPIAYNSYAAVGEIINDGIDGFVVSAFKRKEFEKKLIRLAKDSERWSIMSNEAEKKSKKFSIENIMEKWNVLFSKIPKQC